MCTIRKKWNDATSERWRCMPHWTCATAEPSHKQRRRQRQGAASCFVMLQGAPALCHTVRAPHCACPRRSSVSVGQAESKLQAVSDVKTLGLRVGLRGSVGLRESPAPGILRVGVPGPGRPGPPGAGVSRVGMLPLALAAVRPGARTPTRRRPGPPAGLGAAGPLGPLSRLAVMPWLSHGASDRLALPVAAPATGPATGRRQRCHPASSACAGRPPEIAGSLSYSASRHWCTWPPSKRCHSVTAAVPVTPAHALQWSLLSFLLWDCSLKASKSQVPSPELAWAGTGPHFELKQRWARTVMTTAGPDTECTVGAAFAPSKFRSEY